MEEFPSTDSFLPKDVFTQKDLNLCQRIWLELLKNYDMTVPYHLKKVNMVMNALSPFLMGSVAHVEDDKKELVHDVHKFFRMGVHFVDSNEGGVLAHNGLKLSFASDIMAKHDLDMIMVELKKSIPTNPSRLFSNREIVPLDIKVSYVL